MEIQNSKKIIIIIIMYMWKKLHILMYIILYLCIILYIIVFVYIKYLQSVNRHIWIAKLTNGERKDIS